LDDVTAALTVTATGTSSNRDTLSAAGGSSQRDRERDGLIRQVESAAMQVSNE